MSCLDPQVDLVIQVKGSKTNVTVSWDKKKEEGEADDVEMGTDAHDQKMVIGKKINKYKLNNYSVRIFCQFSVATH